MKMQFLSIAAILNFVLLSSFTHTTITNNLPADATESSCSLPAPSTLEGTRNGTSEYLVWSAVSGASAYKVSVYELAAGGGTTFVCESVVTGLCKAQNGLDANKSYRFILASICAENAASDFIINLDGNP